MLVRISTVIPDHIADNIKQHSTTGERHGDMHRGC